jgi:hypothetical protein
VTGLVFLPIAAEKQHIVFSAEFRRTAGGRQNVAHHQPAQIGTARCWFASLERGGGATSIVQEHAIVGRPVQRSGDE